MTQPGPEGVLSARPHNEAGTPSDEGVVLQPRKTSSMPGDDESLTVPHNADRLHPIATSPKEPQRETHHRASRRRGTSHRRVRCLADPAAEENAADLVRGSAPGTG